jgi:hypothetical protein
MLAGEVPFPYYARLSRRNQAVYRKSDAITDLELPEIEVARARAHEVRGAIETGKRAKVQRASQALADVMLDSLRVPRVVVRVLATRPSTAESELHGLYEREEDETAVIKVWMKTAAKTQVVKFRTFLRTLLHELCHHLDYDHFRLADSFHTHGFFERESSLMRQLAPREEAEKRDGSKPARESAGAPSSGAQLELPLG